MRSDAARCGVSSEASEAVSGGGAVVEVEEWEVVDVVEAVLVVRR